MRQHRSECEARKMTWDDEICTCTLAERDEARAEVQRLRTENERLTSERDEAIEKKRAGSERASAEIERLREALVLIRARTGEASDALAASIRVTAIDALEPWQATESEGTER